MRAVPSKPQLFILMILVGAAYAVASLLNGMIAQDLWPAGVPAASVPLFWLASAFSEAALTYAIVRQMRLPFAITFVFLLALVESTFYALQSEVYWSGFVIGIAFWQTLLARFVMNGHLMFFFAAYAITRATNPVLPWLARTGVTINAVGLASSAIVHFLWNYTQILGLTEDFGKLVFVLGSVMILTLWAGTSFLDDMLEPKKSTMKP